MPERYFPNLPASSHIPLTLPQPPLSLTAGKATVFSDSVSDIGQGSATFTDEGVVQKGAHVPLDVRGDRPLDQRIMFPLVVSRSLFLVD